MTVFATEGQEPAATSVQLSPTAGYYIRKLLRQRGVASPVDPTADLGALLRSQYQGGVLEGAIATLERLAQYHQVLSSQGSQHPEELVQAEREIIQILDRPVQEPTPEKTAASPPATVLSEGFSTDHFSADFASESPQKFTHGKKTEEQSAQGARAAQAPPLILHIGEREEERGKTDPLTALLAARGYPIQYICYRPERFDLRDLLRQPIPGAVVIELKMSESGIELCRALRQRPELADLPIVMVSALHSVSDRFKALKLGINDYLVQPVQPEEMLARLENHLRIQQQRQRLEDQVQRLQAQLMQSQNGTSPLLTQAVLDQHGDYLLFINRRNQIVHSNEAASQRLGYGRAELLAASMDMLDVRLAPQDWQTIWEHLQTHQTLSLNSAHVTKAGETLDVQLDLQYLEVNGEAFSYLSAKVA